MNDGKTMRALQYEHLLRRIHKRGRGGGADASYYRKLEETERAYKISLDSLRSRMAYYMIDGIDSEDEYLKQCEIIWFHISTAIRKVIEDYYHLLSVAEIAELNKFYSEPRLNKEEIDIVIDKIERLMVLHKIYPQ